MAKAGYTAFLTALALAGGTLYPGSGNAQVLPSTKVSSALGPLFKNARERDKRQVQQSQDFMAELGQVLAKLLGSGEGPPDDTPHSAYVQLSRSFGSHAGERNALQAAVESGLVPRDRLAAAARRLEALKEPGKVR